jgi:hypothetical protein
MGTITRYCTNCGKELVVTNVTDGAGTEGYIVGCIACRLDYSGGTIYSSTPPQSGNPNTTVRRA